MPSVLPERPLKKVGADLFTLNNSDYVLVVDYYSRFVELAKLKIRRCYSTPKVNLFQTWHSRAFLQ